MYRRRLSQPFPTYPNLKTLLLENKSISDRCYKLAFMIRQISPLKNIYEVREQVQVLFRNNKVVEILRERFSSAVPRSLKDHSTSVLRVWAHQCECVLAQRLRRGQQIYCLYSRLWEERALREFLKQMRHRVGIRGRDFLLGALGVAAYDWRANRIPESDIRKHSNELDYIYKLKDKTLCKKCSKNSKICPCKKGDKEEVEKPIVKAYDDWNLFIEKSDLVVWRRPHSSGNFEYKVYGSYTDVTAEDFLNVQIDVDYRRQWDNTAVMLNVVETDPDPASNSDIVYWEMLWPTLFANRDYVFNRRYLVDRKSKTLFIMSKSTKHASCPKDSTKYRIEDYWSIMVIKPYTELNKPGIEFSLTYFDNPGVNVPASITTWVAMKAMPDFLERLRDASRKYKKYCKDSGVCQICNIFDAHELGRYQFDWDYFEDNITDNTVYEAHYKFKTREARDDEEPVKTPSQFGDETQTQTESSVATQNSTNPPAENHSFWRFIKRLFK
ncbi:stAR-related lipid transfer protein 7, mitochondrial isoform X2 [Zophobas morio]|uniref:stAR-related lipid transfer protein 7, mitochondrial isoform X2 n=1 Tax=Zophobas morio TaxID=2755281 RepID=UPI0030826F19